ncbi:MAG: helix-turn-helix domain-containing protein [Akkermansiaceae bacterium]|jgi:transposase-like protein|tara:strand:- start:13307 stop:13807 length:501 start_codon:yes stop_codon:yes gene_type:complete
MKSHEVLKAAFDNSSPKAIASELGVSLSLVYKWAQEQSESGSGSRNPLDRIVEIHDHTQHLPIIEWLCEQCNGYFVRNPVSTCEKGYEVLPATNAIVGQFSSMLTRISQAALDNSITPDEAEEIRLCWDKLKSYAEGFVRCCEEGDFELMQEDDEEEKDKPTKTLY